MHALACPRHAPASRRALNQRAIRPERCAASSCTARQGAPLAQPARRASYGLPSYGAPTASSRVLSLPDVTPPLPEPEAGSGGDDSGAGVGSSGGSGGNDGRGDGSRDGDGGERPEPRRALPLVVAAALSAGATAVAVQAAGDGSEPVALSSAATGVVAHALAAPLLRARAAAGALAFAVSPAHLADVLFAPESDAEEEAERVVSSSSTEGSADNKAWLRNPLSCRWPSAEELPWSAEELAAAEAEAAAEAAAQRALAELPLPPPPLTPDEYVTASPPDDVPRRAAAPRLPSLVCTLAALVAAGEYTLPSVPLPPLDVDALRRRTDRAVSATAAHVRAATKSAARTLRVTSFAADAATGAARAELGGRFTVADAPCVVTLSAPALLPRGEGADALADAVLVTVALRGCRAVLRLCGGRGGSGLEALDVPEVALGGGVTVRPAWRGGGALPALHCAWQPAPWQLPAWLAAGQSALNGTLDLGGSGVCVAATHARSAAAGPRGRARHAARLTLRAQLGAADAPPLALDAVYKLKLQPEGLTLGAALGGARGAPAVAFAKARHGASGATLRLTSGLAARLLAAEAWLPDAAPPRLLPRMVAAVAEAAQPVAGWRAQLRWADGRLTAATITRQVAY